MEYEAGDLIWYRTFGGGLRQVRVIDDQIVARRFLTAVPSES